MTQLLNKRVYYKKYLLVEFLGSGAFGDVYRAVNVINGSEVAVKIEDVFDHSRLRDEYDVYRLLGRMKGIPAILHFAKEQYLTILVMELLGPSLETLFQFCYKHFTLKTVLMIADQMIETVSLVHSKGLIHRDVKPDNFLIGLRSEASRIYLIDFGLSYRYRRFQTHPHIMYEEDMSFVGNARYASLNAHFGLRHTRRDDMESLGYCWIYFLVGKLPWQSQKAQSKKQKCEIISEIKLGTSIEELCKGYPVQFTIYLEYCRKLKFTEEPDYTYLRSIFHNLFKTLNFTCDFVYDWKILKEEQHQTQVNRGLQSRTHEAECDRLHRKGKNNWYHVLEDKECRNPKIVVARGQKVNARCRIQKEDTKSGEPLIADKKFVKIDYSHLFRTNLECKSL